jgi:hypothetical protein
LLSLPVRLHWLGPLGLESEILETLDAGRGGLLVASRELRAQGALVWVTLPFDAGSSTLEPEAPAHVARSKTTPSGGHLTGIAFANNNKHSLRATDSEFSPNAPMVAIPGGKDRRRHARTQLALLTRIVGGDPSWPDEAMTVDISRGGLLFCTLRVYEKGEIVRLAVPHGTRHSARASIARVARIVSHPSQSQLQCVGVEFLS